MREVYTNVSNSERDGVSVLTSCNLHLSLTWIYSYARDLRSCMLTMSDVKHIFVLKRD